MSMGLKGRRINVGRPINGIAINGLEYLLGDDGKLLEFSSIAEAKTFLREHGVSAGEIGDMVFINAVETAAERDEITDVKRVSENNKCVYFRGLEDCLCNNDPDDPGDCIYEGGVEPLHPALRCPHYKSQKGKAAEHPGVVRWVDDLGRLVIPKDIRQTMGFSDSQPLEIYPDIENDRIILKKHCTILTK